MPVEYFPNRDRSDAIRPFRGACTNSRTNSTMKRGENACESTAHRIPKSNITNGQA